MQGGAALAGRALPDVPCAARTSPAAVHTLRPGSGPRGRDLEGEECASPSKTQAPPSRPDPTLSSCGKGPLVLPQGQCGSPIGSPLFLSSKVLFCDAFSYAPSRATTPVPLFYLTRAKMLSQFLEFLSVVGPFLSLFFFSFPTSQVPK